MSFCLRNHADICPHPSAPDIEGFRVIDCWTKSIVPAPANCKYVTLSYVWGKVQPEDDSGFSFESCYPVVRDSISLVASLGYRYLWVDRYVRPHLLNRLGTGVSGLTIAKCIDQNDPNKILQINQMDQIYLRSILTIIAAAGQDASYGLPGVGNRQRIQQPSVKLSGATLVQIFPHASQALLGSNWATRAWTYQEGYLAARRLVFTDHQASFLCNKMYSSESAKVPLTAPEEEENQPFHRIIPTTLMMKSLLDARRLVNNITAVRYILTHMTEFSRRHLSYDSDGLNAFLGVLHSFETNRILIRHIWGVPFGLDQPWIMLNWFHERPAVRRDGLPSWSWVGWKGEVLLVARGDVDCFHPERCGIHIQARLTDGTLVPVQDSIGKQEVGRLSPSLQVKGLMVELSLRTFNWDQKTLDATTKTTYFAKGTQLSSVKKRKNGLHCLFELNDRTTALALVFLDTPVLPEGKLYGLVGMETMVDEQYVFLLKDCGGFYERVGFAFVDYWRGEMSYYETFMAYIDSASGEILNEVTITPKCRRWLERGEVKEFELR